MGLSKRVFIILESSLFVQKPSGIILCPSSQLTEAQAVLAQHCLNLKCSCSAWITGRDYFVCAGKPWSVTGWNLLCLFVCFSFSSTSPSLSTKQYKHLHCRTQEYSKSKPQKQQWAQVVLLLVVLFSLLFSNIISCSFVFPAWKNTMDQRHSAFDCFVVANHNVKQIWAHNMIVQIIGDILIQYWSSW